MPRCSYHPDVETELSCTECGKPICPKEMVLTPVGYKCPEHARAKRNQYRFVKPGQLMRATLMGMLTGVIGGVVLAWMGIGFWLIGILWGSLVSESVRRASGGHRGAEVGTVAGICIAIGGFLGFFLGLNPIVPIIALVVALIQLAVIELR